MNQHQCHSVVRRWGFYSGSRLAFGGVAYHAGAGELQLRIVETEHHAHTAPLPERISLEQVVRERVRSDIEQAMGSDTRVLIQFELHKPAEHLVAKDIFG